MQTNDLKGLSQKALDVPGNLLWIVHWFKMAEVESLPTDKAKTKGGELEDSTPTKIRFTITSA
jgi:hypothetical protein